MAKSQLDRIEEKLDKLLERAQPIEELMLPGHVVDGLAKRYGTPSLATAGPGETLPFKQKPITAETRPDPFGGAPPVKIQEADPDPLGFLGLSPFRDGEEPHEVKQKAVEAK